MYSITIQSAAVGKPGPGPEFPQRRTMSQTMKAAVYYGAQDIRIEEWPVPRRAPGEALIRVLRSGICGTDATEWVAGPKVFPVERRHPNSGHMGPLIPGHEFVGEVVEADPAAG